MRPAGYTRWIARGRTYPTRDDTPGRYFYSYDASDRLYLLKDGIMYPAISVKSDLRTHWGPDPHDVPAHVALPVGI